jgi:hypothetical protein
MTSTLRLRCMRCGDWHEREATDPYLPELCHPCFYRVTDGIAEDRWPGRFERYLARYRKGEEKHPTFRTLKATWAGMEGGTP